MLDYLKSQTINHVIDSIKIEWRIEFSIDRLFSFVFDACLFSSLN